MRYGPPGAAFRLVALSWLAAACAAPPAREGAWRDPSPHRAGYLHVNGLRQQYLDWGGDGEPIVFVHGAGDSPHYLDEIAPALTDRHRVVALARRGHGHVRLPRLGHNGLPVAARDTLIALLRDFTAPAGRPRE